LLRPGVKMSSILSKLEKFSDSYSLLIQDFLDKIKPHSNDELSCIIEALKSITEPDQTHTVHESLKGRISDITDLFGEEAAKIYELQEKEDRENFKKIVVSRTQQKINHLVHLSKNKDDAAEYFKGIQIEKSKAEKGKIKVEDRKAEELKNKEQAKHVLSDEDWNAWQEYKYGIQSDDWVPSRREMGWTIQSLDKNSINDFLNNQGLAYVVKSEQLCELNEDQVYVIASESLLEKFSLLLMGCKISFDQLKTLEKEKFQMLVDAAEQVARYIILGADFNEITSLSLSELLFYLYRKPLELEIILSTLKIEFTPLISMLSKIPNKIFEKILLNLDLIKEFIKYPFFKIFDLKVSTLEQFDLVLDNLKLYPILEEMILSRDDFAAMLELPERDFDLKEYFDGSNLKNIKLLRKAGIDLQRTFILHFNRNDFFEYAYVSFMIENSQKIKNLSNNALFIFNHSCFGINSSPQYEESKIFLKFLLDNLDSFENLLKSETLNTSELCECFCFERNLLEIENRKKQLEVVFANPEKFKRLFNIWPQDQSEFSLNSYMKKTKHDVFEVLLHHAEDLEQIFKKVNIISFIEKIHILEAYTVKDIIENYEAVGTWILDNQPSNDIFEEILLNFNLVQYFLKHPFFKISHLTLSNKDQLNAILNNLKLYPLFKEMILAQDDFEAMLELNEEDFIHPNDETLFEYFDQKVKIMKILRKNKFDLRKIFMFKHVFCNYREERGIEFLVQNNLKINSMSLSALKILQKAFEPYDEKSIQLSKFFLNYLDTLENILKNETLLNSHQMRECFRFYNGPGIKLKLKIIEIVFLNPENFILLLNLWPKKGHNASLREFMLCNFDLFEILLTHSKDLEDLKQSILNDDLNDFIDRINCLKISELENIFKSYKEKDYAWFFDNNLLENGKKEKDS
jgi:hypothetical protein